MSLYLLAEAIELYSMVDVWGVIERLLVCVHALKFVRKKTTEHYLLKSEPPFCKVAWMVVLSVILI